MKSNSVTSPSLISHLSNWKLITAILVIVSICMFPTLYNEWVNWDDPAYVLRNLLVQDLSKNGVYTMFSTAEQVGLYHPITLLSLSIDYHIWGTDAFGFHLTNLLFHLANSVLVFALLKKLNLSPLVAFGAAVLFGMHPMHVESVAWISARKDVLYTFFFLISLLTYLYYIRKEGKTKVVWYGIALLAFVLSLLSKSLSFTLPLILLLLDYLLERKFTARSILEKLPFFVLAVIALTVAKSGQEASDSMVATLSLGESVFVSSYNVIGYGFKALVPIHLSAFHPFPLNFALTPLFLASIVPVLALLYFMIRWFKTSRILFFSVAFYLITIVPVSQLIPFGKAISSERYTYVPYIGLFILIALGVQKLRAKAANSAWKHVLSGVVLIWFLFLGLQTHNQIRVWRDSEILWTSVIERYPDSEWAYMSRGMSRLENDSPLGAEQDFNTSIRLHPMAQTLYERGYLYDQRKEFEPALDDYIASIKIDPTYSKSHLNLGVLYAKNRNLEGAMHHFKTALKYDDSYSLAHFNLGIFYKIKGENTASLESFTKAIDLEPKNALYLRHRGVLQNQTGKYKDAIKDYNRAMKLEPNSGEPYFLRSQSYYNLGNLNKAIADANQAEKMGIAIPVEYQQLLQPE